MVHQTNTRRDMGIERKKENPRKSKDMDSREKDGERNFLNI